MAHFSMDDLDDMPDELKELLIRKLKGEHVDLDEEFDTDEKKEEVVEKMFKGTEGQLKPGMILKVYSGVGKVKKLANTSLGRCHPHKMVLVRKTENGRDTERWLAWFQDNPERKRIVWCHPEHIQGHLPEEAFEQQVKQNFYGITGELFEATMKMAIALNHQEEINTVFQFAATLKREAKREAAEEKSFPV
jgi:hypothetical protein